MREIQREKQVREILINRLLQMVDCPLNREQLEEMDDCDLLDEYEAELKREHVMNQGRK